MKVEIGQRRCQPHFSGKNYEGECNGSALVMQEIPVVLPEVVGGISRRVVSWSFQFSAD